MEATITLTLSKAQLEALEVSLRLHLQTMNQTDMQYHDHLKKSFFDEWESKRRLHSEICNSLNLLTSKEGGE